MTDREMRERANAMLKDAANAVIAGGTGAGIALASGAGPSMAAIQGGAGLLPWALTTVFAIARGWKEREVAKWWYELLHGQEDDQVTPEEVAGLIDAHQEEPFVRETVLRSVRALGEAVDPAVVTPLAVLAREYVSEQKTPDAFFRGTARVLADLSGGELADLRRVVSWGLSTCSEDRCMLVAFDQDVISGKNKDEWPKIPWRVLMFAGKFKSLDKADGVLDGVSNPNRLLRLLEMNDLATRPSSSAWGVDPLRIMVETETLSRLARVLGPSD
ncbi:hypothetical protein WME97_41350 [Sorangium sp. So ce367]|uniref:hypothetical protein n=1 Tax=Sorangium sp. So ce367 TaxID=3133305 RepID=UPI003F5F643F